MIDYRYGKYIPVCDGCSEELEECYSFDDALKSIKAENWSTRKLGVDWINLCPDCQKEGE